MPTAPRLTPQVAPAPLPRARRSATLTPLAAGVGVAQAQERLGQALEGAGLQVSGVATRLRAQAVDKANRLVAIRLRNTADAWRLEHLYKPGTGYLTRLGEHALGTPEEAQEALRTVVGDVEHTLTNDEQRLAWAGISADLSDRTMLEVYRHVDTQSRVVMKNELETRADLAVSMAAAAANDPKRIGVEIANGEAAIDALAEAVGMGATERAARKFTLASTAHIAVINNLLATDQTVKANIYFEHVRDEIDGAKLDDVTARLRATTADVEAERAADALWAELGPRNDTDPISLDVMEQRARTLFGDDTQTYKATVSALRMRKQATDDSRRERGSAREGAVWAEVLRGTSFADIRQMPEYKASPDLQLKVRDYITRQAEHVEALAASREGRAAARESRAWTAQQRAEAQREQRGWARYWDLSSPARLAAMTDGEVLALTPELGQDHVNRLMEQRRKATSDTAAAREATIDEQLFNTIADAAGLAPYKATTPAEKATLGQLKNAVETAIDAEQRRLGKPLARPDKQTLMERLVDQRVMLDTWGSDTSAIAATVVSPDDQAVAYVPLATIPARSVQEWVNVIRSMFPSAQRLSDDAIVRAYGPRIQRAHAAAVLHLGAEAERQRLEGR